MARYHPIQNSFVAGEFSPRLEMRDDLEQYFQSLRQARNLIVLPHGGVIRRSGTRYVASVKTSSKKTRLIPFLFSTTQAYVCEFGEQYIRFYTNEGQLVSGTPVEVATPYLEAELFELQFAQEADIMWVVHPKHPPYKLSRTSATSFAFTAVSYTGGRSPMQPENATATTLTVTGSGPYTLTFSASVDLASADDVGRYVRHDVSGTVGWYKITAVSSTTVATANLAGGTATTSTATATWALGASSDSEGFYAVALHEGRLVYGGTPTTPDRFWLSVSDAFDDFEFDPASDDSNGFTKRLVSKEVNAIRWMTSTDEVLTIGTTGGEFRVESGDEILTPTAAYPRPTTQRGSTYVLPAIVDNEIIFLQRTGRALRQLTYDLERDGRVARNFSILAEHILRSGGTQIAYRQHPDSAIFVTRNDGVLAGFTFEREQRVIGAHRHLFGGSFQRGNAECESVAVIPAPDASEDQVWFIVKRTINGSTVRYVEFLEDHYNPDVDTRSTDEERIAALDSADCFFVDSGLSLNNSLIITGVTNADPAVVTSASHGLSNGNIVKLRDIVGELDSNGDDTLAAALNRREFKVANAATNTFELTDLDGNDIDTSGLTAYVRGGTVRLQVTSVSGLNHLEGETIQILADGRTHPNKTVSSGAVSLDFRASIVHVGLAYSSIGETQRMTGGGRFGTDQGQLHKARRASVRLHNTMGLKLGVGPNPGADALERYYFRDVSDLMDSPPPLFSGDVDMPLDGGWSVTPTIYFEQDLPYPMTVLGIMPRMESHER